MNDDPTVPLPLDRLRRLLLVGNRPFVLGVTCFSTSRSVARREELDSHAPEEWRSLVSRLRDEIEMSWQVPVINHLAVSVLASSKEGPPSRSSSKETTRTMQIFRKWRSVSSTILDFGINDRNALAKLGRNCDGILLIVDAESFDAARWIKGLRRESLPWLGYWQVDSYANSAASINGSKVGGPSSTSTPQAA